MLNIIKLLPDSVANQIAAGEVIQRPASAVKELLENAVDAGATNITLIVKDAGKTLVQVIDNGRGMSVVDARMSFERHATSKITKADDLFSIRTMGFRGEALASIAAIAQVEMKSKPEEDEIGTSLIIEGSKVMEQNPVQCPTGTNIAIRNLFYNVPARRNFLKSDNVENRHILDEFMRVSLIHHQIGFSYYNNDKLVNKLIPASFKSRIISLFGQTYNERMIAIEQKTDMVIISGFIGKPEFAKKTRGEQYFFVNKRYIKHAYLNHAVSSAFLELIPSDAFPSYFIHIDIDPNEIDINIHPTKTEINFKDGKLIYAILHAAVKQSIGRHTLTPIIDFDVDPSVETAFQQRPKHNPTQPQIRVNPDYNPFKTQSTAQGFHTYQKPDTDNWESLFGNVEKQEQPTSVDSVISNENKITEERVEFVQVQKSFILCTLPQGLMVIHQQRAHERILFEYFMHQLSNRKSISQQQLFPEHLQMSPEDADIVRQIMADLEGLGFILNPMGSNTFVIVGTPPEVNNPQAIIELIVENFKKESQNLTYDQNAMLARSMAVEMSVKQETELSVKEMSELYKNLFTCQVPTVSPGGKKTFLHFDKKSLTDLFI